VNSSKLNKQISKKTSTNKQVSKSELKPQKSIKYLLVNVLLLIGVLIFTQQIRKNCSGYIWLFDKMIKDHKTSMKLYRKFSQEQRLEVKLGFSYYYLNNILIKNTPEDAIIIMPPDSVYEIDKEKYKFSEFTKYINWCSYFVYPRKLVSEKDKDKTTLYSKATYVAIVNYWGYDKLEYNLNKRQQFTVLPLKQQN
jgi:hypothetical protein